MNSTTGQSEVVDQAALANACEIARADGDTAEQQGFLTDATVQALVAAGVPRLFLPKALGGLELSPPECAAVTRQLAAADRAAAWFVMVCNAGKLMMATWPEAIVESLFADDPGKIVAASGNTPFVASADGDGFRLSGVNRFVSGCHHADAFVTPVLVDNVPHMSVVPMSGCEIVDNWDALGMRGTGSNDVRAVDVWLPKEWLVPMTTVAAANRFYSGPLYRCPTRIVFATYIPIALQAADDALRLLTDLARDKVPYASDKKLKERTVAQLKYGRALATYRAADGYFGDALETTWQRALRGASASDEEKGDLYLAGVHAMQASAEVVRRVAEAAGSSITYKSNPLERIVRDLETLRHHGFASENRYASVAQLFWGAPLDYPLMLR